MREEFVATKRGDPNYSQVSGYIPKDLALKFRVAATGKELSQSEALEYAVKLWLDALAEEEKSHNSLEAQKRDK